MTLVNAAPTPTTGFQISRERLVFCLKWVASIVQIMGYTATAFGMTPLNNLFVSGGFGRLVCRWRVLA